MKNKLVILLILICSSLFAEDIDDINEMTINETKNYAIEQLNALKNSNKNSNDDNNEEIEQKKVLIDSIQTNSVLTDEEKKQRIDALNDKYQSVENSSTKASAKNSITVSLFYPFFMGSGVEYMQNIAYTVERPEIEINGGLDFNLKFVLVDYLLITGGFSWGGSFGYKDDGSGKKVSDDLFSLISFKAGLGGIYPIFDWFSIYAGLNVGYMHTQAGGYMSAVSSTYKDALLAMALIQPFIGMDFEVADGLALSFKFDYSYGISGQENGLKTNKREVVHFPSIYLGVGFLF